MRHLGSSCFGPLPDCATEPDATEPELEWAEYVAWLDRESAAGREHGPGIWAAEGEDPELAELDDEDPASLDPGPEGPAVRLFCQDGPADLLPPGTLLAQLTEQAVAGLDHLSDSELAGVLRAANRQVAREQYKQVLVTAEYGRRRQAAFQDAARRGIPVGCRPGGFPGEELAIELVATRAEARHRIDDALDLTARLPRTLAGMAAGLIDESRAGWIALYTRSLSPQDAARADEILAGDAPELRVDQLARKAASLEMKLNPEAVRARREHARRDGQRVEARREASGNASLAGRELDTCDAMASKAYIDAVAVKLRNSGLVPGSLDRLRALAMTDLTQGRNPLDRIRPRPATAAVQPSGPSPAPPARPPAGPQPGSPDRPAGPPGRPGSGWPRWDPDTVPHPDLHDHLTDEYDTGPRGPVRPGATVPLPALVNLLIPVGTLLGWGTTPAQAGPWGLLDAAETRTIARAAARHLRTRWCATLTAADGTALAHACARGPPGPPQRAATPAPAGPADRAAAPPQPHLHSHRHWQLRPRAGRRSLRPQPQAQAPGPRPHRHLRRTRLSVPGGQHRPGPHRRLARRAHLSVQPRPQMQDTSPCQAGA